MLALGLDPVQLRQGQLVSPEEVTVDCGELLVFDARRLVGALIEAMGFVNDEQVVVICTQADVEGRQHHRSIELGGAGEYFPDRVPKGLLRNH